jgi:hypothetical protein
MLSKHQTLEDRDRGQNADRLGQLQRTARLWSRAPSRANGGLEDCSAADITLRDDSHRLMCV